MNAKLEREFLAVVKGTISRARSALREQAALVLSLHGVDADYGFSTYE